MFKYLGLFFVIILFYSCKQQSLPDPLEAGWKGASVCDVLLENESVRILKCIFPPGVGHQMHYHNPHFGYTIKGSAFKITDSDGTKTVNVLTGTEFSKQTITEHEVLNVGDSIAEFLIVEYK